MPHRVGFKPDDGFVGFGIAQFFAGESGYGGRIAAQRVNIGAQLAGNRFLFLHLSVQSEDFTAHPFVLLDERNIAQGNQDKRGQHHEADDCLRELAPDAEIHFHGASLTACGVEVKADFDGNRSAVA